MSIHVVVQQRPGGGRFRLHGTVRNTKVYPQPYTQISGKFYTSEEEALHDSLLFEWYWLPKQLGHPA
jgi:hypothetical protein